MNYNIIEHDTCYDLFVVVLSTKTHFLGVLLLYLEK